jgi:hypothetical protein
LAKSESQRGWVKKLKSSWAPLAQVAVWVMGIVGSFVLPPPIGISPEDEKIWQRLGKFVVTILIGLMFIAARRWDKTRHFRGWAITAGPLLVLAVVSFLGYQGLLSSCTCTYGAERVVIGNLYTPQGLAYAQRNRGISCHDLLDDFAGKADDIWTEESINRSRMILAETYLSCLPLFAICLMAILQAVSLARPK